MTLTVITALLPATSLATILIVAGSDFAYAKAEADKPAGSVTWT